MGKIMSVYTALSIADRASGGSMPMARNTPSDSAARIKRDDYDEAMVCLTCTKRKCTGERSCFNARKRQLAKEGKL